MDLKSVEHLIKTSYSNITGITVLKNGAAVYENYFHGCAPGDTVHIMSVTKSILSALTGIAIDRGYIRDVHQHVLDFFPDYKVKRGEHTIRQVTVEHLLTMTAPYKYRSEPYTRVYSSPDWTKAALDLLGGRAGITGEFKYSTVGIQILSGILANASGRPVSGFAAEYLFGPLGIETPPNLTLPTRDAHMAFLKSGHAAGWVTDPMGVNTAGWGLCLTPRDMAKIGQLYLNGGMYNGRRILSSNWIQESTQEKSRWGALPYGYLWWVTDEPGNRSYAAIGDGGNMIWVNPAKQMVTAIAARFKPSARIPTELVTDYLVPLLES